MKTIMKNRILKCMMASSALFFAACTDLEVKETDSLVTASDGVFKGVDADGTLTAAYNGLNWENSQQDLYALSEGTTDEVFIPTRGTDWGDNGVWRDLAKHTWTSAHAYNYGTWNYLNGNVYRTNQILNSATTKTALQEAEAKFIRAYNMFWILDLWRQIPIREADESPSATPKVLDAQQAFDFIIKDLEEALVVLPATKSGEIANQSRASKASANYLLAKMYLNKHIYLGGDPQAADMDKVIAAVDQITADNYDLFDGYFEIFNPSADSETILWANGKYDVRIWGSLHYNQKAPDNSGGGWNGFATTAEFFSKFEGDPNSNAPGSGQEERRGYVPTDKIGIGFLIGQQYGPETVVDGVPSAPIALKARSGKPLVFVKEVPALTGQPDYTGIRLLKWNPVINMPGTNASHLVLFRYSDALLMKAEAQLRKGDAANSLTLVNNLRIIRNATPFASLTLDNLLDERGRELYLEGWRRNDLVRFGKFNAQFGFVEDISPERSVFPIPDNALGSNPNLKQNPKY
jgi:hypothetical protein